MCPLVPPSSSSIIRGNLPTIKYWNNRFEFAPLLLLYLLKSGILLTLSPAPLPLFEKGESKAPVAEVSLARERAVEVERARTGRVEVRGKVRRSAREVEVREAIVGWLLN